jgi:TonB family protein
MPLRSAANVDRASAIVEPQAAAQASGPAAPTRLDPASSDPINLSFKDARLRDVLTFIGYATSITFTGNDAGVNEAGAVTIEATIDATAPVERLLDRLLTPNGLTYAVTGPRSVVIASSPLAQVRQAMRALEAERPRRQINTVYPEYPQDALERGIQGTVVVDVTVNAAGDVTTAAVASGPQELRASAFKAALGLKYTKGQSTTAMKIAFQFTLTSTSWGVRIVGDGASNMGLRFRGSPQGDTASTATNLPNEPDATGAYRIGGTIQPPKKIKDMPPEYPAIAQQARVQGVVIVEVRIDERGMMSDTRILRSIPLLDQAAIDAVKQWQYEPTLLNGVAVPVLMTVTVNFTLRPLARIQVTMPDGKASTELWADMPSKIYLSDSERFQLIPSRSEGSPDLKVSVFGDDGQIHLGDVILVPDGPVVQSPTNPSFGLRLVFVR